MSIYGETKKATFILLLLAAFLGLGVNAFADWPTDAQWIPVRKSASLLQDPSGDAAGSRNVVSTTTQAAAFLWNDGTYIYFRLRLDVNPTPSGTNSGLLDAFGWGVDIDTNRDAVNYEWQVMVDGISRPEVIELRQNTVQGTAGDPSDQPELMVLSIPVSGNIRVLAADSSVNGSLDYFLDFRLSYASFKSSTGLNDSSPIRLFYGASPSSQTITQNGGDFVGGSDLYNGLSDFTTATGASTTTGTIRFVADIAGNGDITTARSGDTLYIRVDDFDQNLNATTLQAVSVTLASNGGDSETVTLTETGINTGIFTGSITTSGAAPTAHNQNIELPPTTTTVTASYLDAVDANGASNLTRTDLLYNSVVSVAIAKIANPTQTVAGGLATYTITLTNSGAISASATSVQDTIPAGFSYVAGTSTGLTTTNPGILGQTLTWSGNWTISPGASAQLAFNVKSPTASGTYYNQAQVSGSNFSTAVTGDTAAVKVTAPLMMLTKSVDQGTVLPAGQLLYQTRYRNLGDAQAVNFVISDPLPAGTGYLTGSMKIGGPASSYSTATPLTDDSGDDAGTYVSGNVVFTIPLVAPDDGQAAMGSDEGIVYFKVTVQ